ncbi:MAG: 2-phosphosulfolactate phosphatase [Gemmatimonadetes bacterium]|nr:2-phosphosulfolactate phosphatase [Gemmatimonadota bacterium]
MKLAVCFTPVAVNPGSIAGKPVLVIDILRATTSMIAALAHGAKAILPAASADDALKLAQNLERGSVLLAGERRSERIPGFALGNSPLEMTPDAVAGKTLVMTTTNGIPAILAADDGRPVLIGAAVNFRAAADAARRAFEAAGELTILCAGHRAGKAAPQPGAQRRGCSGPRAGAEIRQRLEEGRDGERPRPVLERAELRQGRSLCRAGGYPRPGAGVCGPAGDRVNLQWRTGNDE